MTSSFDSMSRRQFVFSSIGALGLTSTLERGFEERKPSVADDEDRALMELMLKSLRSEQALAYWFERGERDVDKPNVLVPRTLCVNKIMKAAIIRGQPGGQWLPKSMIDLLARRNTTRHDLSFVPNSIKAAVELPKGLVDRPGSDHFTSEYFAWRDTRTLVIHVALPVVSKNRRQAFAYAELDFNGDHGPARAAVLFSRSKGGWQVTASDVFIGV